LDVIECVCHFLIVDFNLSELMLATENIAVSVLTDVEGQPIVSMLKLYVFVVAAAR